MVYPDSTEPSSSQPPKSPGGDLEEEGRESPSRLIIHLEILCSNIRSLLGGPVVLPRRDLKNILLNICFSLDCISNLFSGGTRSSSVGLTIFRDLSLLDSSAMLITTLFRMTSSKYQTVRIKNNEMPSFLLSVSMTMRDWLYIH